jgi:iron(II)-dependent oxidoreductase
MMWDEGTRDPGASWPDAIAAFMKEIDADGINGDTQDGVPLTFSLAADKVGHPLAFEPEDGPSDEGLSWDVLTWGQYQYQFVPTVDKYRWLQPLHQVNRQSAICLLQRRGLGKLGECVGHLERRDAARWRSDTQSRHH